MVFNFTSTMLQRLSRLYHTRKPRVATPTSTAFTQYQQTLRHARRQVHLEAKEYQDKIEDEYLARHHQFMADRHFEWQCGFRKQVFTNAYRLHENQARWRARDEDYSARLNKHLHEEDLRRINRSRILKIMEHESSHYWFNAENVDTRLKESTVFPEYIASSEYYYKLFAEALAYEFGDFNEVHLFTSNEEIIREKNKQLIPLYLELRNQITAYKRNELAEELQRHTFELDRLSNTKHLAPQQLADLVAKERERSALRQKELQERDASAEAKLRNLRQKVRQLVAIFKTWKEYTNIIGLTSAQVIRNQQDVNSEISINKAEGDVLKSLKARETETFVGSLEEDTEELEITFEEYLGRINKDRMETQVAQSTSVSIEELDNLIKSAVPEALPEDNLTLGAEKSLGLGEVLREGGSGAEEAVVVNPQFLNEKETTSSVEVLKEHFKEDKQFTLLLNQLGEVDVRYPKLFETVWQSIEG